MKGLICGLSRGVKVAAPLVENEPLAKTLAGENSKAKRIFPLLNQKSAFTATGRRQHATYSYMSVQIRILCGKEQNTVEKTWSKLFKAKRWALGLVAMAGTYCLNLHSLYALYWTRWPYSIMAIFPWTPLLRLHKVSQINTEAPTNEQIWLLQAQCYRQKANEQTQLARPYSCTCEN